MLSISGCQTLLQFSFGILSSADITLFDNLQISRTEQSNDSKEYEQHSSALENNKTGSVRPSLFTSKLVHPCAFGSTCQEECEQSSLVGRNEGGPEKACLQILRSIRYDISGRKCMTRYS